MSSRLALPISLTVASVLASACAGENPASTLATPPAFVPQDQTKCGVTKSQSRPLIVEWPSADRGALELQRKKGITVVRYLGCEMEVLRDCRAPGAYSYSGITRKGDRIAIRDEDELYANVPIYAAKLESQLRKSGRLDVDMTIVGAYEADRTRIRADELTGDCDGATHVIASLTAGAFEFSAGADAVVGGGVGVAGVNAGGKSAAGREVLNRDGEKAACASSTTQDKAPPEGCGALLRLEVVPLGAAKQATPACPQGTSWDGKQCAGKQVITEVECPTGSTYQAGKCVASQAAGQVSMLKLIETTRIGKSAKAALKKRFDARQKELDADQSQLKKDDADLDKMRPVLKPDNVASREAAIKERLVALQARFVKYQKEMADQEAALTKDVVARLSVFVSQVAGDRGMLVVYDDADVLWSKPGQEAAVGTLRGVPRFDLTEAVQKRADAVEPPVY